MTTPRCCTPYIQGWREESFGDTVAVEIEGVTFLETPESAARIVAEGKGILVNNNPDTVMST